MQVAIEHGLMILSWYENHPSDEVPPEYIWEDPEGLEKWWERVKDRRDRGMKGPGHEGADADEDLAENEFARAFKE